MGTLRFDVDAFGALPGADDPPEGAFQFNALFGQAHIEVSEGRRLGVGWRPDGGLQVRPERWLGRVGQQLATCEVLPATRGIWLRRAIVGRDVTYTLGVGYVEVNLDIDRTLLLQGHQALQCQVLEQRTTQPVAYCQDALCGHGAGTVRQPTDAMFQQPGLAGTIQLPPENPALAIGAFEPVRQQWMLQS